MTKIQEAKLNMYHAVLSYCDLNSATIGNMPALEASVEEVRSTTNAIVTCIQMQTKIISGHAANKTFLRKALIEEASSIAARLYSYAKSIGNIVMQKSIDISVSQFEKLKDEELGPVCRNVSAAGRPYLSQLGPYNIKAGDLNDFDKHITDVISSVPMPRSAITTRHSYGDKLLDLYQKNEELLKNHLDRQLREFKKTDAQFYAGYKVTRELVNNKTTASQIKGQVTNKKTKKPLTGATITLLENEITAKTGEDGRFVITPVPPATYTLKVDMENFASKTIPNVLVRLGKIKTVKLVLEAEK